MVCVCTVCGCEFGTLISSDVCDSCSEVESDSPNDDTVEVNPAQTSFDF